MREANRKQAMVPEGAIAARSGRHRAGPGRARPDGRVVVVLPGPPRELQPMWPRGDRDASRCGRCSARATPLHGYTLRMFGIPESEIAKSLREIEEDGVRSRQVEITTCLRRGEIEIDVRYRDEAAEPAPRRCGRGSSSATAATSSASTARRSTRRWPACCRGAGWRLAESCSGGLLAARITDLPGASAYFAGGVVAYSNEAKAELLGVDPGLIEAHGAVSPEVAEAMALGALERFGADVAVSITGIAGPDGGSEEKPVGYVCFDARLADGTAHRPRPGDSRRPRRHPRTLGPGRACTCCGILLGGGEAPL